MRARLLTLALLAVPAAADTWIRVDSPSVEIFTDSSERVARAVLDRFTTLHRVFDESRFGSSSARLRVFIFTSRRDFLEYEIAQNAAGFYHPSGDRDLIVAYEDTALKNVTSHEYLHMVMQHSSAILPHWLDEGMAEFYSTISIGKTKMRVGDTIPAHLSRLSNQPWLSAEDLALGNRSDGPIFYAESWALVHMLSLAPSWKDGMPKFVRFLNDGSEPDEAFTIAFGKTMEDALTELRRYLRNPKDLTLPAPPALEEAETYHVTRIAEVDVTLALADLALRTGRVNLARNLFVRTAKRNPQSPAAIAGLASLALAENRNEDAQHEFERAIAAGYQDANIYFELALLKNDSALLEKTLTVDPHFAAAHFLLGSRATDNGNFTSAIEHLREAVAIEPRRFTYWHALGYAQAKSGDRQAAAESARRAAVLASNEQEEQMAGSLSLLTSEVPAVRQKKPDVITPSSWQNRKGDTRVDATLVRVACDSSPVRLVLSTEAPPREIELTVSDPTKVELLNVEGASTTLACGPQSLQVAAEYIAATGELTRIEFKHVIIKR